MGSIQCKVCSKEFPKNQITKHTLDCQRNRDRQNEMKQCEVCRTTLPFLEYVDHRLSHNKDVPRAINEVNPTISYCQYNFEMNKVMRFTRIRFKFN